MISICYGHKPCPFKMSSTKKYFPDTLLNEAKARQHIMQMISIKVGDKAFLLKSDSEIELACNIVASYHNQYVSTAPKDDGWEYDTNEIESVCI